MKRTRSAPYPSIESSEYIGGASSREQYSMTSETGEKVIGKGASRSCSSRSSSVAFELLCADEPLLKGELSLTSLIGLGGWEYCSWFAHGVVFCVCRQPEGEVFEA